MAAPSRNGEEELAVFIYSVVDLLPQAETPQVRLDLLAADVRILRPFTPHAAVRTSRRSRPKLSNHRWPSRLTTHS